MTQSVCGPRAERRLGDRLAPAVPARDSLSDRLDGCDGTRTEGCAVGAEYAPTARAATQKDGGKAQISARQGRAGPGRRQIF